MVQRFEMQIGLHVQSRRIKVMLLVSKHGHCLNHLLHQWQAGELPIDVAGVVSNHDDLRGLVEWYGIAFHHLPITGGDKAAQEARLLATLAQGGAELTVLARYMQVLSEEVCARLEGRCINIHHSFLPSFAGARPYHQAHARGVKVIGATAHYVTGVLDDGPIIEQDTVRVGHSLAPEDFVRLGKDVESIVLARAVLWHAEHRVLLNGRRTVAFKPVQPEGARRRILGSRGRDPDGGAGAGRRERPSLLDLETPCATAPERAIRSCPPIDDLRSEGPTASTTCTQHQADRRQVGF